MNNIREKQYTEIMNARTDNIKVFFKLIQMQRATKSTTTELLIANKNYTHSDIPRGFASYFTDLAIPKSNFQTNPLTNPTKIQQACVLRSRMLSAATIAIPSTQLALMKQDISSRLSKMGKLQTPQTSLQSTSNMLVWELSKLLQMWSTSCFAQSLFPLSILKVHSLQSLKKAKTPRWLIIIVV